MVTFFLENQCNQTRKRQSRVKVPMKTRILWRIAIKKLINSDDIHQTSNKSIRMDIAYAMKVDTETIKNATEMEMIPNLIFLLRQKIITSQNLDMALKYWVMIMETIMAILALKDWRMLNSLPLRLIY